MKLAKPNERAAARRDPALATRNEARRLLRRALTGWPRWQPVRVRAGWNPDDVGNADAWAFRVERESTGAVLLEVDFRDVAPATRPAMLRLLRWLSETSAVADVAVEVARVELATAAKRAKGSAEGGAGRQRKALDENADFFEKAESALKVRPSLPLARAAAIAADRTTNKPTTTAHDPADALAKRLRRHAARKTPKPKAS